MLGVLINPSGLLTLSESTPCALVTSLPTKRKYPGQPYKRVKANYQRPHGPQAPRLAEEGPRSSPAIL